MAAGRIAVDQEPGTYISGTRARWLIAGRRARMLPSGKIAILNGRAHATPGTAAGGAQDETTVRWSGYSGGFHMNGDAINRGHSQLH